MVSGELVTETSRQLTLWAEEANAAHEAILANCWDSIVQARIAGEALNKAKARLKHGEWMPWLAANCEVSQPQAHVYRKIAENWEKIESNYKRADNLSIRGAMKLLAAPENGENDPHVSHNSGENEWYTPPEYLSAARAVMGEIDLDPASSKQAQEAVRAKRFYTKEDDGLTKDWAGRVWMNPPYSSDLIGKFSAKLVESFESGAVTQAIVLVNNATDSRWFQAMANSASMICFPSGRIKFIDLDGNPSGAPLQGQAVLYLGDGGEAFESLFAGFGFIAGVRNG